MQTLNNVTTIKRFFEDGGAKVTMEELKALTPEDRKELAEAIEKHSSEHASYK